MPESRVVALLRLWFGFSVPVGRRAYIGSGLVLAGVKLAGDFSFLPWYEDRVWTPAHFLSPIFSTRFPGTFDSSTLLPLALWALPFVWIGASMSFRRAVDAGLPGRAALLFFVPFVNYLLIAVLCVLPPRPPEPERRGSHAGGPWHRRALLACGAGAALGLVVFVCAVLLNDTYGFALFLGSPFAVGFVAAAIYGGRWRDRSGPSPHVVAQVAALLAAGTLLLFAFEGVFCLAMAYPIGVVLTLVGSSLGALPTARWRAAVVVTLATPFLAAMEPAVEPPLREVVSSIEIDAPPERVWRHVTSFSELPPPREWYFAAGIAYPVRARYVGSGEDAVRYCEFSTGAFVEPITRWEEPTRLSFDVAAQPPTMEEQSPYRHIEPAHLADGLRAVRGEFRLVRRPDGGTSLEGSTWYRLRFFPQAYWSLWSDALIHRIHRRVLEHVKGLSEADRAAQGGEAGKPASSPRCC